MGEVWRRERGSGAEGRGDESLILSCEFYCSLVEFVQSVCGENWDPCRVRGGGPQREGWKCVGYSMGRGGGRLAIGGELFVTDNVYIRTTTQRQAVK